MSKINQKMVFTRMASVRGGLYSSFCFQSEKDLQNWVKSEFVSLEQEYGPLELAVSKLPGLKVGDTCFVWGEASDEFKIEELIEYSPHRYGFVLNSGWTEEVVKCHKGKNYPVTYLKKIDSKHPD